MAALDTRNIGGGDFICLCKRMRLQVVYQYSFTIFLTSKKGFPLTLFTYDEIIEAIASSGSCQSHVFSGISAVCNCHKQRFLHLHSVGMTYSYFLRQSVMQVIDAGEGCFCNFDLRLPWIYDRFGPSRSLRS